MNSINKQNKFSSWLLASRPKTLLAAVVPVLVGSALAINEGIFFPSYSIVALLCSVLIQVGTNFTNDLYDFIKGADDDKRKGPVRVLASGLITVQQMKGAILFTFGLTLFLGLYLVMAGGIIIFAVGVISILAGMAYTAGPYPLAYNGLGDIFVFIFFGIIGTVFTYYLHLQEISIVAILVSIPVGALITNILIVNNYRDIEEDRAANKRTLVVILGREFSKYQYIIFIALSFIIPIVLYLFYNFDQWIFLPFLSIPVAIRLVNMLSTHDGEQLNKTLELTAKFSALYGILFSVGIIL